MKLDEYQATEARARALRAAEMWRLSTLAAEALMRLLGAHRRHDAGADAEARRFMGHASFQERLKNSRPPRIAFMRSTSRSKCSGTSTKFRRSLFTMSSGLSE